MRKALLLAATIVLLLPAAVWADTIVEEIVTRVNGDVITRSDYRKGLEQLLSDMKQQFGSDAEKQYRERQPDVLRDLIDQQLLLDKGKDLGITADTELIKKLDDIRKSNNLSSMEDLEKAAEQQGVNFEDFKQQMRNGIITQQVISQEVGRKIHMTEEEEKKFYEEHKKELEQPETIRLSEILVPLAASATPEEVTAAETQAKALLKQVQGGAKFEEVAKKSSKGPSAEQGGDLGYFKRGTLAKELEDTTFAMKAGQVSDVVRTKQGFVILKVAEHHQAGVPQFNEVKGRVEEVMYYQRLQPALRAYLTKLREEAFIDIREGYVDTGASPNQTKPVETDAKDAKAKELKKKKKKMVLF